LGAFIQKEGNTMKKTNISNISTLAGILAPIIFVIVFLVEGAIRPGYDPLKMYISALSLGPRGWIQILNFMLLGLFLFVFTYGLSKELTTGKASRGGIISFYILAFLFLISGPFVMDPANTPTARMSIHGLIHGLSGGIVFLLMPITIFVFLRRIWVDREWANIRLWTLILFIIETLGVIFFTYVSKIPTEGNAFIDWMGFIQRAALIPFMFWLFIFNLARLLQQK
jgi:hypothetical protein